MNFSKSKYCGLWQCPKIAWLTKYKPEEYFIDETTKTRLENGNVVGDLAMSLFGEFNEVTTYTNGKLDIPKMIKLTNQYILEGRDNICEASFNHNGLYCAVDILKTEKGGYAIYEVKSSTKTDNYVYIVDISYQKYVLEKCGIKVTGTYLVNINNNYIFDGTLNLNELFKITDVYQFVIDEQKNVESQLQMAEKLLNFEIEPNIDLSENCNKPYKCGFWKYCSKHLPEYSVFNLYKLTFKKKIDYYKKGIISYEDIEKTGHFLSPIIDRQIDYALHDKGEYIDKEKLKNFLDSLHYPLYFLDFETQQPVVPLYKGTKPYEQIPFQYSLHYIEQEGAEIKHKEFLAVSGEDPRRKLAESLCNDIPDGACVLAFNKKFECGRIGKLAETFEDLSPKLSSIEFSIKDLLDPFQYGYYYKKEIGGSFSIKSILPAMFPNDPSLNYHNLEGVHNGTEAMTLFPKIKDLPLEEQEKARQNLLKYCELDTFAMVKIWQKLKNVVKD